MTDARGEICDTLSETQDPLIDPFLSFFPFPLSSFPRFSFRIIFVRTKLLHGVKGTAKRDTLMNPLCTFEQGKDNSDTEFWRRLMCCCRCFAHVAKHDLLNFDVNKTLIDVFAFWDNSNCG